MCEIKQRKHGIRDTACGRRAMLQEGGWREMVKHASMRTSYVLPSDEKEYAFRWTWDRTDEQIETLDKLVRIRIVEYLKKKEINK